MKTETLHISKSKYLSGLQCQKLLWFHYNGKDQIPETDPDTQALFDQGHEVGELAKQLFPEGIEIIGSHDDPETQLKDTWEKLALRKPLFEAAVQYDVGFARADILNPVNEDEWDILEVKSSTKVKDVHLHDLSIQYYVITKSGLKIRRCFLLLINIAYVRQGKIEQPKLFARHDVTEEVLDLLPKVADNLSRMAEVLKLTEHPQVAIGPQCDAPYECPLHNMCWAFLPEHHVLTLPWSNKKKGFDLINKGVLDIRDLPGAMKLTDRQLIQRKSVLEDAVHSDMNKIRTFVASLKYPLHFLDFETIMPAVPLYDGTRPYQQIPFQFSLHILPQAGAQSEHHAYLVQNRNDPRAEIIALLKRLIAPGGSIICYNSPFERVRLRELREFDGRDEDWYDSVDGRFIDIYSPFRSYGYYHPSQRGSTSMKDVLPAITGAQYDDLEIADGRTAGREFMRMMFSEMTEAERHRIRGQLENYCHLDTEGMTKIVVEFERLIAL